ncbi:hypothetical protein [Halalkalibacter alkaliphilus]|uniref:DUF3679 domain-containing protein n=1 Tax=Halalkalibacter alkaliphilus TaxID=2917993 RepID=A0A9X2I6M2_9BACI|nr:hypothetical protein [Halalkalibacter alkaliphilus]MCL7747280.1 hypothetical protein [Halalkalibacter alkaliphilus]
MKKFIVKILVIGLLLFLGALFGVQLMNEELGISHPVPLQVEKEEASATINVKEQTITKNELVEKRQSVEEVGRFNFFSDLGNHIAAGLNYVSRAVLSQIMSFVDNVLNG